METAADLTSENKTKLAQAKSKGLTCTLITEALNLDKCWEEIKDLHHLNLQFKHSYIGQPLHGNSTKRQGVCSSLHTPI